MKNSSSEDSGSFSRESAFSRSIGFITHEELKVLKGKTVAIGGLGGVGGSHLITLTRMGLGGFHLADFDEFAIENFNRQAGANLSTVGQRKLDVMEDVALNINPELRIQRFPSGIIPENLHSFFNGVDLYVDGLDYFAFKTRLMVFEHCYQMKIPVVTAGPIGFGAAMLVFMPGQMSFREYFQWSDDDTEEVLAVKFLVGLAPSLIHASYLVDPSGLNLKEKRGPSTPMACELCAGCAGTEAVKILLKRGSVKAAPQSLHFDAFTNKMYSRRILFGNRNPIQMLKISKILKTLKKAA